MVRALDKAGVHKRIVITGFSFERTSDCFGHLLTLRIPMAGKNAVLEKRQAVLEKRQVALTKRQAAALETRKAAAVQAEAKRWAAALDKQRARARARRRVSYVDP
ncbi:hypothetical protein Q5752_005417 [Cryptotrichosporon argae]